MRVKDLPIYPESPEKSQEYQLELKKLNAAEEKMIEGIKPVRTMFQSWFSFLQQSTETSIDEVSKSSKSVFEQIRDEPVVLARGGFIAVCGFGGVILGYKGGAFRKLFYGSVATSLATSACYPAATYTYTINTLDSGRKNLKKFIDDYSMKTRYEVPHRNNKNGSIDNVIDFKIV